MTLILKKGLRFRRDSVRLLWTPAAITTALWLDAADSSTITTVNGAVSQWNDKSGNSRNVSQTAADNRPTLTTENNLVALSFDGINDSLSSTSAGLPTGSSARSMFAVYRPLRTDNSNNICGQGSSPPVIGSWYMLQHRNLSVIGDPYFAGYSADLTDSATPTTVRKMAGITYNGTQATLYRNATQIAQSNLTLNTSGNNFFVGVSPAGTEFARSAICEIVFAAYLTTTNTRQQVEGYLAHKWGLTANLPNDHPFKVNPPYV